jgi:hypothetical protein
MSELDGKKSKGAGFNFCPDSAAYPLSTNDFAKLNGVKPHAVHKQHSRTGTYLGVRPEKGKNRLLHWPAVRA